MTTATELKELKLKEIALKLETTKEIYLDDLEELREITLKQDQQDKLINYINSKPEGVSMSSWLSREDSGLNKVSAGVYEEK